MSDSQADLDQIRRAAAELVPELTDRLRRDGLGEIEVSSGDLRVRVSGSGTVDAPSGVQPPAAESTAAAHQLRVPAADAHGVPSPAVGYFVYGDGLGPGLAVEKGDQLGFVEVLGVRHDVRAPRSGTIRNLVTETGEAVEYGQTLLELEPVQS